MALPLLLIFLVIFVPMMCLLYIVLSHRDKYMLEVHNLTHKLKQVHDTANEMLENRNLKMGKLIDENVKLTHINTNLSYYVSILEADLMAAHKKPLELDKRKLIEVYIDHLKENTPDLLVRLDNLLDDTRETKSD